MCCVACSMILGLVIVTKHSVELHACQVHKFWKALLFITCSSLVQGGVGEPMEGRLWLVLQLRF